MNTLSEIEKRGVVAYERAIVAATEGAAYKASIAAVSTACAVDNAIERAVVDVLYMIFEEDDPDAQIDKKKYEKIIRDFVMDAVVDVVAKKIALDNLIVVADEKDKNQ